MRDVLAEELNLLKACLLHGVLEVNVLAKANFLTEQHASAWRAQPLTLTLQAPDDTGVTL